MDTVQHVSVNISPGLQGRPHFLDGYSKVDYRSVPFLSPKTRLEYLIHFSGEGNAEAVDDALHEAKSWILEQEMEKTPE
jgi:hypothetical protein